MDRAGLPAGLVEKKFFQEGVIESVPGAMCHEMADNWHAEE
jgi:hypothetical protein